MIFLLICLCMCGRAVLCTTVQADRDKHQCTAECAATSCLSDPVGFRMDLSAPQGARPNAKAHHYTMRGTNANEFSHPHLHSSIAANLVGTAKAACNVSTHVHQWNVKQGIRRLGEPNLHTFDLRLLCTINGVAARSTEAVPYPTVTLPQGSGLGEQLCFASTSFLDKPVAEALQRIRQLQQGPSEEEGPRQASGPWGEPLVWDGVEKARGDGRCLTRAVMDGARRKGRLAVPEGMNLLEVGRDSHMCPITLYIFTSHYA
jgi:hypothetical protein